jgi:hypothetical protein
VRRAIGPIAVALAATAVASFLVPNRSVVAPAVAGYLTCLAACAAWWLIPSGSPLRRSGADPLRTALTRTVRGPATPGPDDLLQLDRLIVIAHASALDTQARLRPRLRQLACSLLSARRGDDLDPAAGDVAGRLGLADEPLLERSPSRLPSIGEAGVSLADLSRVLDRLEAI